MNNNDFWKEQYRNTWEKSALRENLVQSLIEQQASCGINQIGLGAGSTEFLSGSASSHGLDKGGSDLQVNGTNIFIEVTGPQVYIHPSKPLWLRPDKIEYAEKNRERDCFVVHCNFDNSLMRIIHLDNNFFINYRGGNFALATPIIRGVRETYVEIQSSNTSIKTMDFLIEYIINTLARGGEERADVVEL
jgi:hypothetical protein